MAPEAIFGEQAEHRDAAEDDADEGEDEDRLMQRQRLKRQIAEDRTGFGCGMRDHKGSRLGQDTGRAARAFSAGRSGFAGTGSPSHFGMSGATGVRAGRASGGTGAVQT